MAYFRISLLVLLLSSCGFHRTSTRSPAPVTNLTQVLADPAVQRVTKGLQTRGFELKELSVSQIPLLTDAPGAAFALADGSLHIHAYRDEASATLAANRIVNGPVGQLSWAFPPIFYQCESAIVMYAGSGPSAASALRQLCASPFYVHASLREHSAELLGQGPGELRLQVSQLDVRRRQITNHIRRKARRAAGAQKCAAIELPASAFLPVEVTGDATPELAVSLNQVSCPQGVFGGSLGGVVQFWSTAGRQSRLILEQQVEGFTPTDRSLITLQHGSSCGAAGSARCLVTYYWTPKTRTMLIASRVPVSASDGWSRMSFDYDLRRRAPVAAVK